MCAYAVLIDDEKDWDRSLDNKFCSYLSKSNFAEVTSPHCKKKWLSSIDKIVSAPKIKLALYWEHWIFIRLLLGKTGLWNKRMSSKGHVKKSLA